LRAITEDPSGLRVLEIQIQTLDSQLLHVDTRGPLQLVRSRFAFLYAMFIKPRESLDSFRVSINLLANRVPGLRAAKINDLGVLRTLGTNDLAERRATQKLHN